MLSDGWFLSLSQGLSRPQEWSLNFPFCRVRPTELVLQRGFLEVTHLRLRQRLDLSSRKLCPVLILNLLAQLWTLTSWLIIAMFSLSPPAARGPPQSVFTQGSVLGSHIASSCLLKLTLCSPDPQSLAFCFPSSLMPSLRCDNIGFSFSPPTLTCWYSYQELSEMAPRNQDSWLKWGYLRGGLCGLVPQTQVSQCRTPGAYLVPHLMSFLFWSVVDIMPHLQA